MDNAVKSELEMIKKAVLNVVEPEVIYLFGSYTKGTASEDSDFDVYVVIPDNSMLPLEAMQLIGNEVFGKQTKPLELLVGRASRFHQRKLLPTLERTIATEGMIIYEKNRHS